MSGTTGETQEGQGGGADDSQELLPIFAYEEEPPIVKTREEIVAEKLALLKRFAFTVKEAPDTDPSGAGVYLDVCQQLHKGSYMKFPTTGVARDLRAERETLDLSHAGLGHKGATALAGALRVNTAATSLVLADNDLGPSAAFTIARAITETRLITSLDFSMNHLGTPDLTTVSGVSPLRGGSVVNELLGIGSGVTSLSLRSNHFSDADVVLCADTLADNVNLVSLDLSENKLGPSAAVTLSGVLSRNSSLREFNLEWNQFGPSGCRTLLGEGFLQNNTIKSFNMSACGLDDASALLVARIIVENATEEIIIANNRITSTGADAIAKALVTDSSLVSLVMDGNPIGDNGALALINATAAHFSVGDDAGAGNSRTLRLLSIQHCGCSSETEAKYRGAGGDVHNSGLRISEGFGKMVVA